VGLFGTIGKVLGGAITLATGVNLGGSGSSSASAWPSWDPRSYSDYSPSSNSFSEDGRRWSAAKQEWQSHAVRAAYQSPKPYGVGLQKKTGGPGGVLPAAGAAPAIPAAPVWTPNPADASSAGGLPFDMGAPLGGPNAPPAWVWAAGGLVVVSLLVVASGNRARR
jgi:hypothetical protein